MRGDQLARQWRIIQANEASPNGLNAAEVAEREETGIRTIYRDLEALQAAGFPLYTERVEKANRWAFIHTFKFKISPIVSRKAAKVSKKTVLHIPVLSFKNKDLSPGSTIGSKDSTRRALRAQEYDGVKFHTRNPDLVTAHNFDQEYLEYDVQRRLELESFGYTFLRINKFSLLPRREGETPTDVLSGMLERAFS